MWRYIPDSLAWTLLTLGFISPPVIVYFTRQQSANSGFVENTDGPASLRRIIVIALPILLIFTTGFFVFSANTHFLGDGYETLSRIGANNQTLKIHSYGEVAIHRWVYSVLSDRFEDPARLTFIVVSGVSGVAFLILSLTTSITLFRNARSQFMFFTAFVSGGYMLLFFGYVEYYSIFVPSILLFTFLGVKAAKGSISSAWPLISTIVATTLHIFGLILLPAALILFLRHTRVVESINRIGRRTLIIGSMTLTAGLILLYFYLTREFLILRFAIVPIFEDCFTIDGYTLFSIAHLLDFLNLILILVPGLPLVTVVVSGLSRKASAEQGVRTFLMVLSTSTLISAFLLEPHLGMPRDWDLLSFAGLPLSIAVLYFVLKFNESSSTGRRIVGMMIALGVLTMIPRVYCQVVPEAAVAQVQNYFDLDVKKSMHYIGIAKDYCKSQGDDNNFNELTRFFDQNYPEREVNRAGLTLFYDGKYEEAIPYFERAFKMNPKVVEALFNKGLCLMDLGRFPQAAELLDTLVRLNRHNASFHAHLAVAALKSGQAKRAEKNALIAHRLDPEFTMPIVWLIQIYEALQNREEKLVFAAVLSSHPRASLQNLVDVTQIFIQGGLYNSARISLNRAIASGLDSTIASQLSSRIR
ncbi:MAG: tetratricopeptide repeat protein [bacterium]|nr:tetratricopeptide repeat protein [bacterium]